MSDRIVSFVLSGGVGSRLWPLSREDYPKQFHDLTGGGSMLGKTLERIVSRTSGETPAFVIASTRHADRVQAAVAGLDLAGGCAILEPMGRNTAAAVAVATLQTLEQFGDAKVLIVPSDHEISTAQDFWASVEAGAAAADSGSLVVFGKKPGHPETGYGYIEVQDGSGDGRVLSVERFVEKPDLERAKQFLAAGTFYWNLGIFLFRAGAMRDAFLRLRPDIWEGAQAAMRAAERRASGTFLPGNLYGAIPSDSVDYAIMEKTTGITMVPASFSWSDLGSWQSLFDVGARADAGNVLLGDVMAIDCENSYLRSTGPLLSAVGLRDMAVVATADAVFAAPIERSQNVKQIFEGLQKLDRCETRITPLGAAALEPGAWRPRVRQWIFEEALPRWAECGVDTTRGGFHEALGLDGRSLEKPKRIRTMARQTFAFSQAAQRGWTGPASRLVDHGVAFLASQGRTANGGWVRTLNLDGSVADPAEDAYDLSCVLLALAHAHGAGHPDAAKLGGEALGFILTRLAAPDGAGYLETSSGGLPRRSNPHMHLLEAFMAWHAATGSEEALSAAAEIVRLFEDRLFDRATWSLGEYFEQDWSPAAGEKGDWIEAGHHFEWAALLVQFGEAAGRDDLAGYARKLDATACAAGINRRTGLAYGAVTRIGRPIDRVSRSWPQGEAIRAAVALDRCGGGDFAPEAEARVARLFRAHIDPAPRGLWIDRIDERGRAVAEEVPASILYHLLTALTEYLDAAPQA